LRISDAGGSDDRAMDNADRDVEKVLQLIIKQSAMSVSSEEVLKPVVDRIW